MVDATTDRQTFGQWLRHRRRELDLTQEELGHRVGCAPITVRKLESDQMRPSKQLAELLMERLGIPVEQRGTFIRFARGGELTESVSAVAPKYNLPHSVSSFIGREREIVDIQGLLSTSRLVTLTGAGGCGKSRLALEVARGLVDTIENGVWWVELAALTVDSLVPQTIARAFGLREAPNQETSEILLNYLRDKRLLLVIDNCEHLIKGCAELSEQLLQECPNLGILATSREPLAIGGEVVYQVSPLSLPEADEVSPVCVLRSEAARMFVERAQAVKPDFALTEQNATAVVQICHRLDGIPLALELAAARIRLLTVEHIAERLDDRFSLLTSGSRTALPRQQTLRATIDWSYELLSERTKTLFRRLSVFAGGFSLSAIEAVCSDERVVPSDVLPELSRLMDRSLVEVVQKGGQERYRMLETIRLYAVEKLQESDEEGPLRGRHLKYFTEWAEEVEPKLRGHEQMKWWDQMEIEHDNIRSALNWSLHGGDLQSGLRLAVAAFWFWQPRGYWREGLKWLQETLAQHTDEARTLAWTRALVAKEFLGHNMSVASTLSNGFVEGLALLRKLDDKWWTAHGLVCQGWYLLYARESTSARARFEEAVDLARGLQDAWILGTSLRGLGAAIERFDYSAARPILEESVSLFSDTGDEWSLALAMNQLGTAAWGQRDYAQAGLLFEEALDTYRKAGDRGMSLEPLFNLAYVVLAQGNVARAAKLLKETLVLGVNIGYKTTVGNALVALSDIAIVEGQPWRSAMLSAAGEHFLESIDKSVSIWPWFSVDHECYKTRAREQLEEAEFAKATAEGQAMTLEQAVQYALEGPEDG